MIKIISTAFFLFCSFPIFSAKMQFWQSYSCPFYEKDKLSFLFYHELRTTSYLRVREIWLGVQGKYQINSIYDVQLHYRFYREGKNLEKRQRITLQLQSKLNIFKNFTFSFRHRYETIFPSSEHFVEQRFRQRTRVYYHLHKQFLKTFSFHNETFYSFTKKEIEQIRIVPIHFQFEFSNGYEISPFFMIRLLKRENKWTKGFVLGYEMTF